MIHDCRGDFAAFSFSPTMDREVTCVQSLLLRLGLRVWLVANDRVGRKGARWSNFTESRARAVILV